MGGGHVDCVQQTAYGIRLNVSWAKDQPLGWFLGAKGKMKRLKSETEREPFRGE